jgi:tetratricopeptide (TPR) repeat protein
MDESNVFVSAAQKRWRPSKRSLLVASVILVVIVLGGGTGLYLIHRSDEAKAFNSALSVASENTNNYAQKVSRLQSVIGDAHTKQQKIELYGQLALAASNAGDTKLAEHYYEVRHELDPSTIGPDAAILASMYQFSGQRQQAIAQYNLSIQYLKTQQSQQKNPREAAYIGGEVISENEDLSAMEGQQ